MNETIKEKRVRFLLIGFFVLIILFAFLYRNEKQPKEVIPSTPLVLTLQQSKSVEDNPVVAMYEYKNTQHILAIYEIDRNDRYRFEAKYAIQLEEPPGQLAPDSSGKGIWVDFNGDWSYFSESLEKRNREIERKLGNSTFESLFNYDETKSMITIGSGQSINLENGEKPIGLHSLAKDGSLWLVHTKTGIIMAMTDKK